MLASCFLFHYKFGIALIDRLADLLVSRMGWTVQKRAVPSTWLLNVGPSSIHPPALPLLAIPWRTKNKTSPS
jgi:hypothetical protein